MSINHNFCRERRAEADRTEVLLLTSLALFSQATPANAEIEHWVLCPQKPLRLIRDGEVGGSEILYLTPTRYTVTTRMILHEGGQMVSHFNVSLIVWAKSQDSVHEQQFLKRRERRVEAGRTKVLLLTSQVLYR